MAERTRDLVPPHADKLGAEWTRDDCITFIAWSHRPVHRLHVLSRLVAACRQAGIPLSNEEIEDLWSDFCMRLHLRIQGFDPSKGALLGYLIRGLVQSRKHTLRRRQRREVEISEVGPGFEVDEGSQEQDLESKQLLSRLRHLLNDDYFHVIYAHYYMGKSTPDIARALDVSESLVRMRLFRARMKLRGLLDRREWRIQ